MHMTLRHFTHTILLSMLLGGSVYADGATTPLAPVDLNHATVTQLTTLKGIGKKRAEAIVSYRETHGAFHQLNELAKVPGMSTAKTETLLQKNPNRLTIGK